MTQPPAPVSRQDTVDALAALVPAKVWDAIAYAGLSIDEVFGPLVDGGVRPAPTVMVKERALRVDHLPALRAEVEGSEVYADYISGDAANEPYVSIGIRHEIDWGTVSVGWSDVARARSDAHALLAACTWIEQHTSSAAR